MSFRVGIILPRKISIELQEKLYNKYHIKLKKFKNKMLLKYYTNEEATYQISEHGDDSDSGIGSYEIYSKSLDEVYNSSMEEELKVYFIKDFMERKDRLEKDANKWVEIINELINENYITRIGIFHFNGYDKSENIKFNKFKLRKHKVINIRVEDIMKIRSGEIHFWNLKWKK